MRMLSSIFKFFERIPKSRDFMWVKIAGSEPFNVKCKGLLDARELLLRIREDSPSIKNHDLHKLSLFSPENINQKISFAQSLASLPESSEERPFLLVPPPPPAPKQIFLVTRKRNKNKQLVVAERNSYLIYDNEGLKTLFSTSAEFFDSSTGIGVTAFESLVDQGEYTLGKESLIATVQNLSNWQHNCARSIELEVMAAVSSGFSETLITLPQALIAANEDITIQEWDGFLLDETNQAAYLMEAKSTITDGIIDQTVNKLAIFKEKLLESKHMLLLNQINIDQLRVEAFVGGNLFDAEYQKYALENGLHVVSVTGGRFGITRCTSPFVV